MASQRVLAVIMAAGVIGGGLVGFYVQHQMIQKYQLPMPSFSPTTGGDGNTDDDDEPTTPTLEGSVGANHDDGTERHGQQR